MSTENPVNQILIDLLRDYTVNVASNELIRSLTPNHEASNVDPNSLNSIKECLEDHFSMTSFFRTGAFENGTSISGYSGVDYIAEIPDRYLSDDPTDILRDARDALSKRLQCSVYVNAPKDARELFTSEGIEASDYENYDQEARAQRKRLYVSRGDEASDYENYDQEARAAVQGENCPSVVVPFSTDTKGSIRVIPADFIEVNDDGHKIYEIPRFYGFKKDFYGFDRDVTEFDTDGRVKDMRWELSSPGAHNAYLRRVDADLQKKVKPLIRLIKAWKYFNNIPISSYYLEKKVTEYADDKSSIVYTEDVKGVFEYLEDKLRFLSANPIYLTPDSDYITPCSTLKMLEIAYLACNKKRPVTYGL